MPAGTRQQALIGSALSFGCPGARRLVPFLQLSTAFEEYLSKTLLNAADLCTGCGCRADCTRMEQVHSLAEDIFAWVTGEHIDSDVMPNLFFDPPPKNENFLNHIVA